MHSFGFVGRTFSQRWVQKYTKSHKSYFSPWLQKNRRKGTIYRIKDYSRICMEANASINQIYCNNQCIFLVEYTMPLVKERGKRTQLHTKNSSVCTVFYQRRFAYWTAVYEVLFTSAQSCEEQKTPVDKSCSHAEHS